MAGPIVINAITDGTHPGLLFVDWEPDEGAPAYQVEWYLDSAFTQVAGNAAVSISECTIDGLTPGKQYWVRVRAVRGDQTGSWSDPATRIANI